MRISTIPGAVEKALRAAGVPIDGVSVGRIADKASWRVDFTADATPAHKMAAQAVIDVFDPATEAARPAPKTVDERLADLEIRLAALERGGK